MIKSITDVDVKGKKILCRVDYNVPMKDGEIKDDTRIVKSIPTIKYILDKGGYLILTSHLGRPKGVYSSDLSLKPVSNYLSNLLGEKVAFATEFEGNDFQNIIDNLGKGYRVVLLENTRFYPGETKNDEEYSRKLASYGDIFVSDAFGSVHRAHSSTVGVTKFLPGYAGLLVSEEYTRITNAMKNPKKPTLALVGGAKVSTKLEILQKFIDYVDLIAIGGGMAYTFLKALGYSVGDSLIEEDMIEMAKNLLEKSKERRIEMILPRDVLLGKNLEEPILENGKPKLVNIDQIPTGTMGLDIGPDTIKIFCDKINNANTIIWNGPVGVFENDLYKNGTMKIAETIVERNVETVIGGGDTAYAIAMLNLEKLPNKIHVSTGGGATLELLSGIELPGIECLTGKINSN